MASQTLADLQAQVKATTDAEDAATQLLNGLAARIQAAIDAAIANGATAAELKPVADEVVALKSSTDALSAAVVANTPAGPPA